MPRRGWAPSEVLGLDIGKSHGLVVNHSLGMQEISSLITGIFSYNLVVCDVKDAELLPVS